MLKAQAAYDTGKYSEAIEHLNKVVAKDTSNQEARVRLAFALKGSIGVLPLNVIKSLVAKPASGGTGTNTDLSKLTSGAGLSRARVLEIRGLGLGLADINTLRTRVSEFQTLQNAFLTLCPFLSKQTLTSLRESSPSALTLLQVDKCNDGLSFANDNVTIATLILSIDVLATLLNTFFDLNGDFVPDALADSKDASSKLSSLNSSGGQEALNALNAATQTLARSTATIKSDAFKLFRAQIKILVSLTAGSNFPSDIKAALEKGVRELDTQLDQTDKYIDAGKATSNSAAKGGDAAEKAAKDANEKAQTLLAAQDATKTAETCKNIYCFRTSYGLSVSNPGDLPTQCTAAPYTCSQ